MLMFSIKHIFLQIEKHLFSAHQILILKKKVKELSDKEKESIFNSVDRMLTYEYELLIANAGKDESLYLVDLKEEVKEC